MKICHMISSPCAGGAELYVSSMSQRLARRGHEVSVIYISEPEDLGRSPDFGERFKADLAAAGVRAFGLGHRCRRNPMLGASRLRRLLAKIEPDIVHAHLYFALVFLLLAGRDPPVVYTHHTIDLGKGRFLFPIFDRIVSAYVGISDSCAQTLLGKVRRPVRRIFNGIDTGRFGCVDRRFDSPDGKVRLIAVGSLGPAKNYRLLLEALSRLDRDTHAGGRWQCEIVGEGPERLSLERAISEASLGDTVRLVGNQSDIAARLARADVYVMSSRYEGFPMALLEATASGLPAVVCDVGGCREIVGTDPAVLVPPGDAKRLADALAKMIVDPDLRARISRRNTQRAAGFDVQRSVDEHLAMYGTLVPGGSMPAA